MCGVVGVISKYTTGMLKQHEDSFSQLLYVNALRGDDSTGVIGVEKDGSFHIAKEACEAAWFQQAYRGTPMAKAMFSRGQAMIGHNRKKTMGKIEDKSAHPFVINDEFAMVHNGTLYNHRALKNTDVDSEALAHVFHEAFATDDYQEKFAETLGKVSGAYAVAMYDQRHEKVRLFRNKERPLAYVSTDNGWYFASEAPMLFWIMLRNGYDPQKFKIEVVPEFTLLSFDLVKKEMTEEKIEPKKPSPPVTTGSTGGKATTTKTIRNTKTKNEGGMSKNAYKRFRRRLLGTRLEWWVDDYVESNFPKTEGDGETSFRLMGEAESIDEEHMVVSTVDIAELCMKSSQLATPLWTSKIVDMTYDTKTQRVTIQVDGAKPLPFNPKPKIIDAEYIRKSLDEQEKALVTLH